MTTETLRQKHAHACASRDYCLTPPKRRPEDVGEDIFWLMGYADWAIEADLIEEELRRRHVLI